jgi:hypothetical protein
MKSAEFTRMAAQIWGHGFHRKAALALGIDRKTVGTYVRGKTRHGKIVTIKTETADSLAVIYAEFMREKKPC